MRPPRSKDEYLDLVDQAIFEIDELLMCAEDEGDGDLEFTELLPVYEQLADSLRILHADIQSGAHAFASQSDLEFMPLVREWKNRIPFSDLLEALNTFHRVGF